jgi:hypothetical protein
LSTTAPSAVTTSWTCVCLLLHLTLAPETDHDTRHRLSSQPGICHQRGMHRSLGHLQRKAPSISITSHVTDFTQARIPLPLHLALAEDSSSLPPGQQRLGIPKVRPINNRFRHSEPSPTLASRTLPCIPASTSRDPAICRTSHYTHKAQKEQLCGQMERTQPIRRRRVRPDITRPKR